MQPILIFDLDETLVNKSGVPYEQVIDLLTEMKFKYRLWMVSFNDKAHLAPRSILECFEAVIGGFHSAGKYAMISFLCEQKNIDIKRCILFDDLVSNISEVQEKGLIAKLVNPRHGVTKNDVEEAVESWRFEDMIFKELQKKPVVAIGSSNLTKVSAVAFVFPGWDLIYEEVSSGISSQPVGIEETINGANNRMREIKKKNPDADAWVGVENGLLLIKGSWVDAPVISLKMKGMWTKTVVGAGIPVPFSGSEKMTDYQLKLKEIANNVCEHFTDYNVSRGEIIKQAVKIARYSNV